MGRISDDRQGGVGVAKKVAKRMPDYFGAKHQEQPDEAQECWPGFHFFVDRRVGGVVRSPIRHDKGATGIRRNAKAAIAFSNRGYDARAVVQVVALSRAARTMSFGFFYAA